MKIFGRRSAGKQDDAIADFWAWWAAEGKPRATVLFDSGEGDARGFAGDVARRVHAIHRDLSFETGQGRLARHVLVVTGTGDARLRDVVRQWLAAAPAPDDAFEYAGSRQPVNDPSGVAIALDANRSVDLASATVVPTVAGATVHVQVSHPAFAELPDDARGQITFLFLDALLGEEVVEESIGEVSWALAHETSSAPLMDLRDVVAQVRGR